jgi:hypothetical protein
VLSIALTIVFSSIALTIISGPTLPPRKITKVHHFNLNHLSYSSAHCCGKASMFSSNPTPETNSHSPFPVHVLPWPPKSHNYLLINPYIHLVIPKTAVGTPL